MVDIIDVTAIGKLKIGVRLVSGNLMKRPLSECQHIYVYLT
jgi:hypothetical protein